MSSQGPSGANNRRKLNNRNSFQSYSLQQHPCLTSTQPKGHGGNQQNSQRSLHTSKSDLANVQIGVTTTDKKFKFKNQYPRAHPTLIRQSNVVKDINVKQQPYSSSSHNSTFIREIPNISYIQRQITRTPRYMAAPVKIDYEACRTNAVVNETQKRKSVAYYKLCEPMLSEASRRKPMIAKIIDAKRNSYNERQPIKLGANAEYQVVSLEQFSDTVSKYINDLKKPNRRTLASSTRVANNKIDQLIAQESYSTCQNDSIDLSFDGKALDKSDILRIVDSFSVGFDDDDDDEGEPNIFSTTNILPREMTSGVF